MSEAIKLLSMGEQDALVRSAFERWYYGQLPDVPMEESDIPYCWVMEVYPEYVIICMGQALYYQVTYTFSSEGVSFGAKETWTRVEKDWQPAKSAETLVYMGDSIKTMGDGKIGGYLARFGGRDLQGEFFTSKTYFGAKNGDGCDCLFHHTYPLAEGLEAFSEHIFAPLKTYTDDVGIFAETVLSLADEYEAVIHQLVEDGKLGWSSGTMGHTVRRKKDGEITRWIIGEGSLTPTPAEFRNRAIPLKSFQMSPEVSATLKALVTTPQEQTEPEAVQESALAEASKGEVVNSGLIGVTVSTSDDAHVTITVSPSEAPPQAVQKSEDSNMSDENTQDNAGETPDIQARFDEYDSRLKSVSDGIDHLLKIMENTPKGEGHVYSNMGGGADPAAKSFGDFLLSIKRKDEKRLKAVYKSAKAMSEDQGATGGYLVPTDFSTQLIAAQAMMSPIIPLVQTYPVSAPSGDWPVLDFYTAPTAGAGNTAFAAQLVSSVIAEGGTFTDRNVKFRLINWRVAKVGDLVKVSSEMAEDAPALDALLRQVMTTALAAKKERGILRGTGVGEPLGILNAPAKIAYNPATSNVFAYADSVGMKARLKVLSGDRNRVRWVYHLSVLPDMAAFQVASGSTATLIQSISGTDPTAMAIWTYALLDSEHMPQADNDNSVLLADFGSYGIWQRGEIEIAISEDYAFNTDEITWRFKERYDGRPLAASSVTLADPQGSYTVSPFIGLTATHS